MVIGGIAPICGLLPIIEAHGYSATKLKVFQRHLSTCVEGGKLCDLRATVQISGSNEKKKDEQLLLSVTAEDILCGLVEDADHTYKEIRYGNWCWFFLVCFWCIWALIPFSVRLFYTYPQDIGSKCAPITKYNNSTDVLHVMSRLSTAIGGCLDRSIGKTCCALIDSIVSVN